MANKLKIYACSGIGASDEKKKYNYWLDNTSTIHNTQAVNNLLSIINLNYSEIEYIADLTDSDVINRLNTIDLMCVCLQAAQDYSSHYTKLGKAGKVISRMLNDGDFNSSSIDNDDRNARLDMLLNKLKTGMESEEQYSDNSEFEDWWHENVVKLNTIGLTDGEQERVREVLNDSISGIGSNDWQEDKDIAKYLNDSGSYFLYLYFTPEQLDNLPRVFTTKNKQQKYIYDYCKGIFTKLSGTEDGMKRVIRSGIIRDYGSDPETICDDIALKGKDSAYYKGVGEAATGMSLDPSESIPLPPLLHSISS